MRLGWMGYRKYSTHEPQAGLARLLGLQKQQQQQQQTDRHGSNPITSTGRLTPEESWNNYHNQRMRTLEHIQPLSLYSGRTVTVGKYDKNNITAQADRAWRMLNRTLVKNDVKRELMLRERYEKPHEKRRRLRRERWAKFLKYTRTLTHTTDTEEDLQNLLDIRLAWYMGSEGVKRR